MMLESIEIRWNNFGNNLTVTSQIAEALKENRVTVRKEMNYRKFLCAFTEYHADSVCLRFDKMMLTFVYYPFGRIL
jgi:hypothetical protein